MPITLRLSSLCNDPFSRIPIARSIPFREAGLAWLLKRIVLQRVNPLIRVNRPA
ncbi:hypothetical protein GRAN_2015 [Granulicella sibirica]|uniref:Uncharacterized protein n=1 Tax=Granulicella sibirica TaxID=2479048 RepID=A0A4Q0T4P1_9BACT|nr:hypothetical protein GRAN_2015 [Granulicella sibirica]